MVLHDLPTGAMRHLDRFLGLVGERGGRIRQEFPPDCMPMVDGEMRFPIDGISTPHPEVRAQRSLRMAARELPPSFETRCALLRMRLS